MRGRWRYGSSVPSIQPQLWIERAAAAVEFYKTAFGASVLFGVGEGDDVVVQLAVGDAVFWVSRSDPEMGRFSPASVGGTTGRTLLIVDDPEVLVATAVLAGAAETTPVQDEHGWRLGRIVDPFGHEWEIGHPTGDWPPG